MRTTLTIDHDLMKAVRYIARDKPKSMGFPTFFVPEDAHLITLDDVQKMEDEGL